MTRKALLVIDMLNDFLDPRGALYCGESARSIIPAVRRLMEDFSRQGHLIVVVKDAHRSDDPEFRMFPPHAVRGTWGGAVIPELPVPQDAAVVEKTRYSAFFGTPLEDILKDYAPEEVWVVGGVHVHLRHGYGRGSSQPGLHRGGPVGGCRRFRF